MKKCKWIPVVVLAFAGIALAQDPSAPPINPDPPSDLGQAQLDFANGLFHRGFNSEAADEYAKYLAEYPNGANRGVAEHRMGQAAVCGGAV